MKKITIATAILVLGGMGIVSATANAAVWKKCTTCHNFTDKAKVGPGLAGIVGRKAASMKGFKYKFAKYITEGDSWLWDEQHLREWMCNSKKAVKKFTGNPKAKTRMPKMKVCDAAKQDEVLAKLKSI